jgi:hypothetical protein
MIYDDCGSIFDKVNKSNTGKIVLNGCWVENILSSEILAERAECRRHVDFSFKTKPGIALSPGKWAVRPSLCPDNAQ